jgi:hypothetical protein
MLALVGFAVGYAVGAQQGKEGLEKLVSSWQAIQKSEEFAAMMETAREMLTGVVRQAFETGTGVIAGEVKGVVNRRLRVA